MKKKIIIINSFIKKIKEHFFRSDRPRLVNAVNLVVLIAFLLFYAYHQVVLKPKTKLILDDLESELSLVMEYKGLKLTKKSAYYKSTNALVTADYTTTEDQALLIEHYKNELEKSGWKLSCFLHKETGKTNCFIKGDYVAIIQDDLIEKKYWENYKDSKYSLHVSFSWGLGGCSDYCD